jgi:hypothetical protein
VPIIRIPRKQWGKAWRAMLDVGPFRLIGKDPVAHDPIFEVAETHVELLKERGFSHQVVTPPRKPTKRRHAASD